MILVVAPESRGRFASDLAAMHSHRKAVFVDRAGWQVPVVGNQEMDHYDLLENTVYLLAKDEPCGPVLASARLLATTGPHLMQDLYSSSYRPTLPSGPTTWEVSRFCTNPGIGGRSKRLGLLWEIICGIMETALEHGIDQVIFAANRALLPLALGCGWDAKTVGITMTDRNDEVTAVIATVTPDGLRNVRRRHGVPDPVIRHQTEITSEVNRRNTCDCCTEGWHPRTHEQTRTGSQGPFEMPTHNPFAAEAASEPVPRELHGLIPYGPDIRLTDRRRRVAHLSARMDLNSPAPARHCVAVAYRHNMKSQVDIEGVLRRRRQLIVDYQYFTSTRLRAHIGRPRRAAKLMSGCLRAVRRQFLSHYAAPPPRWRLWIRQFQKERALPDFCIIGPAKSGTSDLAVTIMSHPNVLYPLVKEPPSTDPLAWRPFYPTQKSVQRHARRHGVALCPFVGPYLHCLDIPITLSALRPDVKVVIILRNPVDLMFSMWKWNVLQTGKQLVDRVPFLANFATYVDKTLELVYEAPGPLASALHCGIYAPSVSDWLQAFGKHNVRILDVAEYFTDRNAFFLILERFLGLPHVPLPERLPVANRNPLDGLAPDPSASAKLRQFFEPYNRRLWDLLGTTFPW